VSGCQEAYVRLVDVDRIREAAGVDRVRGEVSGDWIDFRLAPASPERAEAAREVAEVLGFVLLEDAPLRFVRTVQDDGRVQIRLRLRFDLLR
jgi:hypothetical protein